ncbi:MAG: MFS transporter [Kangiellaceae bacterium]|nr:MFS transporter [Kangiellaceae bacterium]MCW9016180.1 MFS transporter [Kangiellaceae bacterium]
MEIQQNQNNSPQVSQLKKLFKSISTVEPHEINATFASFFLGMTLMAAYYLLRPVRDALSSDWSDAELSLLWTINFGFSFLVVSFYGLAASKLSLKKLVPAVYIFFASTFFVFYLANNFIQDKTIIDKSFYVWVSVYSLFQISVFWSFMAEKFSQEQSKRLFGIITSGASIGAIIGPSIALLFSELGTYNLMLIACGVLLLTFPLITHLNSIQIGSSEQNSTPDSHSKSSSSAQESISRGSNKSIGGSSLAGFKLFFSNPFLLGIGLFLFLYTGISSFVYFELKNLMADMAREQRTEIWAVIDLATNLLTIIAGFFVTSRLATRFGIGFTLALIPLIVMLGMLWIAVTPFLAVVVFLQIFRRGGSYAITRPAREMLFTYVDQETRFKAKQVIDIVVYRGGDVFWAWGFTFLTTVVGLGITGVAIVGSAICALWSCVAFYIGKQVTKKTLKTNSQTN